MEWAGMEDDMIARPLASFKTKFAADDASFNITTAFSSCALGVWKAPRGAGERDLLGICGGIGRFDDHQTIAASPPPSPPV